MWVLGALVVSLIWTAGLLIRTETERHVARRQCALAARALHYQTLKHVGTYADTVFMTQLSQQLQEEASKDGY